MSKKLFQVNYNRKTNDGYTVLYGIDFCKPNVTIKEFTDCILQNNYNAMIMLYTPEIEGCSDTSRYTFIWFDRGKYLTPISQANAEKYSDRTIQIAVVHQYNPGYGDEYEIVMDGYKPPRYFTKLMA